MAASRSAGPATAATATTAATTATLGSQIWLRHPVFWYIPCQGKLTASNNLLWKPSLGKSKTVTSMTCAIPDAGWKKKTKKTFSSQSQLGLLFLFGKKIISLPIAELLCYLRKYIGFSAKRRKIQNSTRSCHTAKRRKPQCCKGMVAPRSARPATATTAATATAATTTTTSKSYLCQKRISIIVLFPI